MASTAEQRRIRLKNDYQTMVNIKRPWLDWRILRGEEPYVEEYELTVKLRTITDSKPSYSDHHKIKLSLPSTYPHSSAPQVTYEGSPKPFHPNWFTNGGWCYGTWLIHESLGQHVKRMLQTLQYDIQITNVDSPANTAAKSWYLSKKDTGIFPCDTTELPDPTTSRLKLKTSTTKKFVLKG